MNLRKIAYDILYETIRNEAYSNLLMRQELNNIPAINRPFVTNLVNGVLRKYELLQYQVQINSDTKTNFSSALIIIMALYERFFLNEKDYVVNNEYVALGKDKYEKGYINALLHKIDEITYSDNPAINNCLPDWIYKLLSSQYDEERLNDILNTYQNIPRVYYRLNKHKANYDDLKDLDIEIINDDLFISDNNLINTNEYLNGYFYIQDYNSASLYKHLDLKPNLTLLDVCSAPGSKLFNCLDILNEKDCFSNDVNTTRLNLIKDMAIRLGFDDINYLNYDGRLLKDNLDLKFDRILLDEPCSGLGVIARKPDLKFHISPESLDELQLLQYELLSSMNPLLKDDGILLYSTCTINRKENDKLINRFINENKYELLKEDTIINEMGDCFYYAKIRKLK